MLGNRSWAMESGVLLEERRTGNGDQAQCSSASSSCAHAELSGRDEVGDVSCGGVDDGRGGGNNSGWRSATGWRIRDGSGRDIGLGGGGRNNLRTK